MDSTSVGLDTDIETLVVTVIECRDKQVAMAVKQNTSLLEG